MSFADNSFDYAFIAAALHRLPRPLIGLCELIRVDKYGVIEPNDSWLTRWQLASNSQQKLKKATIMFIALIQGILIVSPVRSFTSTAMFGSLQLIWLLKISWSL